MLTAAEIVSSILKYKVTRFGGVDDFVTMGNVLNFLRTDTRSMGFWAKWSPHFASVFGKLQNTSPFPGWDIFMEATGQIGFALYNRGDTAPPPNRARITTNDSFGDERWHHVCATYDGSSTAAG